MNPTTFLSAARGAVHLFTVMALLASSPVFAVSLESLETPAAASSLAPRLAPMEGDRAVLSWLERDAAGHRLVFSEFDGEGFGKARTIASGNFFANWADTPGLVTTPEGPWFAHWLERSGQGTYAYDVRVAVSLDRGVNWSDSFTPHRDGTLTEHGFVSGFLPGAGRLGLAWLDGRETAPAEADQPAGHEHHGQHGAMTLRTATVGPDGSLADEALLDGRVCDCCNTGAALTEDGPVVVYRDRSEDEVRDTYLVRRTEVGWSDPVRVHEDGWRIAGCPVNGPAVIARGREVIVAWFTLGDDAVPRVRLARSGDAGRSFETPLTLDEGEALGRVDLAWAGDGFVMVWMNQRDGGVMRLAHFEGWGEPAAIHDLTALDSGRGSGFPRLLGLADGSMLLAWTDSGEGAQASRVRVGRLRLDD